MSLPSAKSFADSRPNSSGSGVLMTTRPMVPSERIRLASVTEDAYRTCSQVPSIIFRMTAYESCPEVTTSTRLCLLSAAMDQTPARSQYARRTASGTYFCTSSLPRAQDAASSICRGSFSSFRIKSASALYRLTFIGRSG